MILVDSMATKNKKIWRSTVRMDKVLGCLKWLKENNPLYSDINILDSDDPCVQQLLDMVFHEISVEDEEDLDATADKGKEVAKVAGIEVDSDAERPAAIRHVDEEERMGLDIQSYSVTKLQADQPICSDSELYCKVQIMADPSKDAKNLVYKCFPSLFPRARNGPVQDSERQTRVSEQQLLRALYNNATEDGRKFREHKNFLFFLQNERNRKDQNNGVYASMNMMRVPQNMSTAKDFVDKLKRKDGGVESCIANSFAQIPGTKEYWNRQRNNLIALQQTYGSPTWFLTLSCAEYLWADIAQRLKMRNPHLANASINQLLSADPMGFAEQFKLRVESFFDKVILARQTRDKIGPLGKVSHYFWRYEYQMRGAPHIHCLLWVEGAPILKEDCSNKDDVLKYIDEHITCRLPANDDMDNATLLQLVARFQKHTCTGSCLRQRRMFGGRNISFCRYHFPRPARSETLLRSAAESVKSRMRKSRPKKLYDLKRGFDESHINDYNPAILLAWEANMDLQYVGDESMVLVKYVTGYVGKHDKGSTADVWSVMNRDAEVKSRLWKYSAEILNNREIGQNEAADRILGNQLYKFSYGDSPIFLNTRPITMRYRRLKPISKAENLAKEGSSLESLFSNQYPEDYYTRRPDTWEDVYLYECFRNWRYAGEDKRGKDKTNVAYDWPKENKSQDVNRRTDEEDADVLALIGGTGESDYEEEEGEDIAHEDGDVAGKTERKKGPTDYVKLKSEAGCLKKRFKPCVVATSWYNIRQPDQKELQYRALLMLFKPWRKEADLKGNAETWEQAWMEWDTSNPNAAWRKDYVALKTVIDVTEKIQKFEDEVELEEALAAEKDKQTTTGKVNQVDPDELLEQMDVHDGEQLEDEPVDIPQAYNLTTAEVKKMESRLNAGQREVYDKVIGAIEHQKKCTAEKKDTCPDCVPLREIVSGVGGTGKSFLIEGPFINYDLDAYKCKEMRSKLADVDLFIIDEFSMISNVLFEMVNCRLNQIFKVSMNKLGDRKTIDDSTKKRYSFGGRNLILFGDILQLKPVCAEYIFQQLSAKSINNVGGGLVLSENKIKNFNFNELQENVRQQNDTEFAEMLARIRLGNLLESDIEALGRLEGPFNSEEEKAEKFEKIMKTGGKDCVMLVPLCTLMETFNHAMLVRQNTEIVEIPCIDRTATGRIVGKKKKLRKQATSLQQEIKRSVAMSGGLEEVLSVCVGARVMLRKNLNVEVGLVNGAIGIVKQIHFDNKNG